MESFKLKYDKNNPATRYFSEHPVSEWSYLEFETTVNKDNSTKSNSSKTKNAYLNSSMRILKNRNDIPEDVKTEIDRLIAANEEKSSRVTFNISARDSSTINATGTVVLTPTQTQQLQQPQPQQDSQTQQSQDKNEEYDSDEYGTRFPSDVSIDHHPRRTSDYSLSFQENLTQSKDLANDIKRVLNDNCTFDLCFNLKSMTIRMINTVNPANYPIYTSCVK